MRSIRLSPPSGFTLIEMLVSVVVLLIIMGIIFQITSETGSLWKGTTAKIQGFQAARAGFESMSRRISQATLNTYYDYFDSSYNSGSSYSGTPYTYGRQSDLHFISGPGLLTTPAQITHSIFFQAPLGYADPTVATSSTYSELNNALNAVGYYIIYNSDKDAGARPAFVSSTISPYRYRYRLMQFSQTTQNLTVFQTAVGNANVNTWFTSYIFQSPPAAPAETCFHLLAENVIALVILPKESTEDDPTGTVLSPNYSYNSRTTWTSGTQPLQMNQLPPIVHLAMVALDEPSALRICTSSTAPDSVLGIVSGNLFSGATGHAAANLNTDLATLENTLTTNHLTYRLFETDVAIRGAKWSN